MTTLARSAWRSWRFDLDRLANLGSMRALREGMLCVIPAFIFSALLLAIAATIQFFDGPTSWVDHITAVHDAINRLIPFLMAGAIGFMMAIRLGLPRLSVTLLCATMVQVAVTVLRNYGETNAEGMIPLLSLGIPLLGVPFLSLVYKRRWTRLVADGVVEPGVTEPINLVVPGFLLAGMTIAIVLVMGELRIPQAIGRVSVLGAAQGSVLAGVLLVSLNSLLWLIGVHGYHALRPAFDQMDESVILNAASMARTGRPDHIVNGSFLGSFVFLGGSGGTAALVVAMLVFSKHPTMRAIAIASVPIALLNVNELVLFGLPIVFSLRLGIPFLLVPLMNLMIAWAATHVGLLAPAVIKVPLNTPMFANAFVATGGSYAAPVMQVVLIVLGAMLYAPFVRRFEAANTKSAVVHLRSLDTTFSRFREDASARVPDPLSLARRATQRRAEEDRAIERISHYEFFLVYQPQVSRQTGRFLGCEALIRASDADGAVRFPGDFMPWLESAGLHKDLDRWVVRAAADQANEWRAQGLDLRISVNLCADSVADPDVVGEIATILDEANGQLSVEVTESLLVSDTEEVRLAIERFHQAGARVYIDDFGCGYSALGYLHQFAFDALKIDRSFVQAQNTPRGREVLDGLLAFADALDLDVVVEGVETADQLSALADGRDLAIQGWYFAKALEPAQLVEFAGARAIAGPT